MKEVVNHFDRHRALALLDIAIEIALSDCEYKDRDPQKLHDLLTRRFEHLRIEVEQLYR